MKKIFVIAILISLLVVSAISAFVTNIYPREIRSGESTLMVVTMYNDQGSSIRDAKLTGYIPYLGVRDNSQMFRIGSKKSERVNLYFDVPKVLTPDYYPVMLTLTNEKDQRVKKGTWVYIS